MLVTAVTDSFSKARRKRGQDLDSLESGTGRGKHVLSRKRGKHGHGQVPIARFRRLCAREAAVSAPRGVRDKTREGRALVKVFAALRVRASFGHRLPDLAFRADDDHGDGRVAEAVPEGEREKRWTRGGAGETIGRSERRSSSNSACSIPRIRIFNWGNDPSLL